MAQWTFGVWFDVGQHLRAVLQPDDRHDVGQIVLERGRRMLLDDGKAVDLALTTYLPPVQRLAVAIWTEELRVEDRAVALLAMLRQ
jgi:hypothetical protein